MTLLAGLGAASFVYLMVGVIVGVGPRRLRRRSRGRRSTSRMHRWLDESGVDVSPLQFVAVSVLVAITVGLAVWVFTSVAVLGVAAGCAVSGAPRAAFARRRRHEAAERVGAWPDAIRDLVTHLRASMSLHAGLVELGRTGPVALRPHFVRYGDLAAALDQRAALEAVRDQLADPLSDRVIEVLLIAFEQGSSVVVDILDELAHAATDDLQLVEEIETAQLETRIEAIGATVLPFVVLAFLCATSPGYRDFYSSPGGWFVVAIGGVMSTIGLFAISRLGRIPGESRVLVDAPQPRERADVRSAA